MTAPAPLALRKLPITCSNTDISICEPVTQHPRGRVLHRIKEKASDEPLLSTAARCQLQLRVVEDPEDNPCYLKALLDSMNDHRAWEAPLSVGIEHSMRESGPFIDLTGGEGSSSGAGPSEVKEEPEDEETRLAREYAWFIHGDAP
jgi:hypothetical protein